MVKDAVLRELGPLVSADYPLAKLTSFKVGGPADFFAAVRAEGDFVDLVRKAWALDLPVFIMGNGSNILLADKGIRGLVIHNRCDGVTYESADEALVIAADAGAMLPRVAREAIKRGFHDLVYATGIPGTIGGAVMSNAGAYGWCMGDNLSSVRFLARDGAVRTEPAADVGLRLPAQPLQGHGRDCSWRRAAAVQAGAGGAIRRAQPETAREPAADYAQRGLHVQESAWRFGRLSYRASRAQGAPRGQCSNL